MAAKVEIYTWRFCPFCIRAKALLDRKGVAYTEYAIDGDQQARSAMTARAWAPRLASSRSSQSSTWVSSRSIATP